MKISSIAILGECMVELSEVGGLVGLGFAGDTLNTAIYLKRLAPLVDVHYVTAIGKDSYSQRMRANWASEGLETHLAMSFSDKLPGIYAIETDECGERTFNYWRSESAASHMVKHPEFPEVCSQVEKLDAIYLSGISLAIVSDEDKATLLKVISRLKQRGIYVVVDSNYRPRLWDACQHARQWMTKLYQLADLALVTADDEIALWGGSELDVIPRLNSFEIRQLVVKRGAEGACWRDGQRSGTVETEKVGNVIDTTAAGDSFNAAYLAAWCSSMDMAKCCYWGNKLAAQVIQHKGAIIPTEHMSYLTELMGIEHDE
ncbi:sugar kinase [uncultured Photobacterium sp.]|uniref:sugar kinase n=1 Tax=uncultured Photobacterium sp. TaxID=173973 RepID=UPI0026137B9A|nr:sugar kinase [uncultured Photobacterium sp.]